MEVMVSPAVQWYCIAISDERRDLIRDGAKQLMRMVKENVKPRDLITKKR